ncbi:phage tail sheath subtilisin-like domain-containing protein [Frankia sp. QA3]|uniref:phage tail sheath family protein n=1 Tax=Frankia sp. QA3 TaxID=710111 RepID=UPI000269C006|nr:phage tail sheath subtilisin-like domain-containing protein [Frankia sp. QA3]EIV92968.1 phage tail sheath protein FI [Frankia sp. QA3]
MPNYRSPGVYVEEVEAGSRPIEGVGTAVAAFVGFTARGPRNEAVRLANWGQYVQVFGDLVPGAYLPLAVFQYFNNGGGACYVVSVGAGGEGAAAGPVGQLTSGSRPGVGVYQIEAVDPGIRGSLAVEIAPIELPAGEPANGGEGDGEGRPPAEPSRVFTVVVTRDGRQVETFENVTARRGRRNVVTVVNEQSQLVRLTELGGVTALDRAPAPGSVALRAPAPAPAPRASAEDFVGDVSARSGIRGLAAYEDITMVVAPDLMFCYQQGQIGLDTVQAVQQALIDHCENMGDRMAILDPPPGLNAQQIKDWVREKARYDSKYATLYWPWVSVFDPVEGGRRFLPPSGSVAGIWGRSDDTRGVHKAPANEVVRGALDLETTITRAEHDALNPEGINVIRAFPGRGIRVWGARTLSSDPAWRYVNVRRLFNYLEASILGGTQWAVFEPNDLDLWQRLRRTVGAFLLGMWRDGALFGVTPEQAFYVKCDEETNPPGVVDAGQVIIEIGVAPVKPAEFVVFRIAQITAGGE